MSPGRLFDRREVPREQLLLIIRSFGGTVAWAGEGSPHAEADEAITHQVRCSALTSAGRMPLRQCCGLLSSFA